MLPRPALFPLWGTPGVLCPAHKVLDTLEDIGVTRCFLPRASVNSGHPASLVRSLSGDPGAEVPLLTSRGDGGLSYCAAQRASGKLHRGRRPEAETQRVLSISRKRDP